MADGKPGRPVGLPKTGGRKVGSLDKAKRQMITDEMAGDILTVYRKMGGVKWLFEWASQPGNGGAFIQQCLARLMPAFPRESGPEVQINTQFNGATSDFEAARRIAYTLTLGLQAVEQQQPEPERVQRVEPAPTEYPAPRYSPTAEPEPAPSRPLDGDAYQAWIEAQHLPPEVAADRACAAAPHLNLQEQGRSLLPPDPPEPRRRVGIPPGCRKK